MEECENYLKNPNLSQKERRFAEQRREEIMRWPWKRSIMEKFPEYRFRPTSLMMEPRFVNTQLIGGIFSLIFGICLSVYLIITQPESEKLFGLIPILVIVLPGILLLRYGLKLKQQKQQSRPSPKLQEIADYVSCDRFYSVQKPYAFFVINRKFGVLRLNINNEIIVIIPAEYDKLTWKEKGNILIAEINGETFLIDIYGKRLS